MTPLVSVIISTRNRGDNIIPTVNAILKNDYPSFEIIVVDQSADELTAQALKPLCAKDSRVRYVKSPPTGKSLGLNMGMSTARGEYVAFTDDDCEPDSKWLAALVQGFQSDAKIGCIFGDVMPGPHDPTKGYIPAVRTPQPRFVRCLWDYARLSDTTHTGMGASLGARGDVLKKLQGFDPCLCPGGRFNNGDESDFAARTLLAGYVVFFSPDAKVTHFGFREHGHVREDYRRWARPRGAAFAKYLRLGIFYRNPALYLWFRVKGAGQALIRLRRPSPDWRCIPAWFGGFFEGLRQPLDRQKKQFKPVSNTAPSEAAATVTLRKEIPQQH